MTHLIICYVFLILYSLNAVFGLFFVGRGIYKKKVLSFVCGSGMIWMSVHMLPEMVKTINEFTIKLT